jgi:hypothetical protein
LGALFTAGSLVNGHRQLWCTVLVQARLNADYRVFWVIWSVCQPHYKAISKRFSRLKRFHTSASQVIPDKHPA